MTISRITIGTTTFRWMTLSRISPSKMTLSRNKITFNRKTLSRMTLTSTALSRITLGRTSLTKQNGIYRNRVECLIYTYSHSTTCQFKEWSGECYSDICHSAECRGTWGCPTFSNRFIFSTLKYLCCNLGRKKNFWADHFLLFCWSRLKSEWHAVPRIWEHPKKNVLSGFWVKKWVFVKNGVFWSIDFIISKPMPRFKKKTLLDWNLQPGVIINLQGTNYPALALWGEHL